jgi:outer membrane protein
MKKVTVIAFLICSVIAFYSSHLHAQALKIGVFDVQKVMRESKKIDGYRQELFKKNIEPKRKPLMDKEAVVKLLEEKLRKDGQTLSPDERRSTEERLATEAKELKRFREDLEIEIQKIERELIQKSFRDIGAVIRNIADTENYTIIFEKTGAGVAYLKDSLDITGKIINQLK